MMLAALLAIPSVFPAFPSAALAEKAVPIATQATVLTPASETQDENTEAESGSANETPAPGKK